MRPRELRDLLLADRRARYLVILFTLVPLVFIIGFSGWLWLTTPDVGWLRTVNPDTTAMMQYRQHEQRAAGHIGQPRWQWVPLSQISPHLVQAVVQSEDVLFFDHRGFNWERMWQAVLANLRSRSMAVGASTLTQQVAKNLFLSSARTPTRKLKEAVLSYRLERELPKTRILELYLNIAEWGPGVYGAEAAAQRYFKKPAAALRLSEAVRLAAVLPNPRRLSPLVSTDPYSQTRPPQILAGMLGRGWISRTTHEQVLGELRDLQASQAASPSFVPLPRLPTGTFRAAEHWTAKMSTPDRVMMSAGEIAHFNERAILVSGGTRVLELPDLLSGKDVTDKILEVAGLFAPANPQLRYDRSDQALDTHFYRRIMSELNLDRVPDQVDIRYALVTKRADVLAWPVDDLIMDKPRDYAFNSILQSTVYRGTPVAVLHTSTDGTWAFIRSVYFDGWIKQDALARTTRAAAGEYPGPRFLIVTAPSVRSASGVELMMGTAVRLLRRSPDGYVVHIPARGSGGELVLLDDIVRGDGLSEGFLPYTRRNVLVQAFKLLDAPYSWGGSTSGFDCSTFLHDVFAVFGIRLPRNSSWQAEVGRRVARFEEHDLAADRLDTVRRWQPGVTLLRFPGHIMMYLGEEAGQPYAIHAVWGVKDRDGNIMKIDKVAVTDLDLGSGATAGSLLERVTDVRTVALESSDLRALVHDLGDWLSVHPLRVGVAVGSIITMMLFVGTAARSRARRFGQRG